MIRSAVPASLPGLAVDHAPVIDEKGAAGTILAVRGSRAVCIWADWSRDERELDTLRIPMSSVVGRAVVRWALAGGELESEWSDGAAPEREWTDGPVESRGWYLGDTYYPASLPCFAGLDVLDDTEHDSYRIVDAAALAALAVWTLTPREVTP